jgi:hypothetical protein
VPPHLIITDEDASLKVAITKILPDTTHKLCMWHIMDKVPEKVRPSLREDQDFWDRMNSCVWGSETREEFVMSYETSFCYANFWYKLLFCREIFFDEEGNILDEKPIDPMELSRRKEILIPVTILKILSKWWSRPTKAWTFGFLLCATFRILLKRLSLMQAFANKMNLRLSLIQRFQMKLIYILPMISSRRGDVRGSRKARR